VCVYEIIFFTIIFTQTLVGKLIDNNVARRIIKSATRDLKSYNCIISRDSRVIGLAMRLCYYESTIFYQAFNKFIKLFFTSIKLI